MKVHRLATVLAASAASLALAGPAAAAPGAGAEVVKIDGCTEIPDYATVCAVEHFVTNGTVAGESGNVNFTQVHRYDNSFTGAGPFEGCNFQESGRRVTHSLTSPDGLGQFHVSGKGQSSQVCEGVAVNCEFQQSFTYANGEVRHDASRLECEPGP